MSSSQGGAIPAGSPSERLDEQRMEAATAGLLFQDGAVKVQRRASADPQRGETLRLRAEKTIDQNVWFISVGAFRDAILADPTNAKSFEGLARALLMEGKTDRARPALATAIQLDPKLSSARYEFGMVRQMAGDYAGAVAEWRALVRLDPSYKDAYARMAIASYYAGDYGPAWQYLAEADKRHQNVPPQFRPLLKEADQRP